MAFIETYSKRQRRLEGAGKQDVYQYDELPPAFRVQVIHIWNDAIGVYYDTHGYSSGRTSPANRFWSLIHSAMARELGVFTLTGKSGDPDEQSRKYLMIADTASALDIIELSFRVIDKGVRDLDRYEIEDAKIKQDPDDAIEELNVRFKEHGIGYQYFDGVLVRLDSQFAHAELVKPALALLNGAGFEGPADEFMRAFEHYRQGRKKEAVAEALKAFESTMKSICATRKWSHPPNATAIPLIDTLFKRGLIPSELASHFSGLRTAMESGLPTVSNKTSRHGQGVAPIQIPSLCGVRFAPHGLKYHFSG